MKKYNLLSYEECVNLTNVDDSSFYETKIVIDTFKISIFNYRIATYNDFIDNKAFEMRGLTFIFNEDGSLFKRHLLLHKFFNLNQVTETQYSLVCDYKIKSVYNKEDGSVASFIRLPSGRVLGKSKMSIESDQAIGANRLYNNDINVRRFVDWSLDNNYVAIFEYVSPFNKIVLKYNVEELILLRLRDNDTGEYLNLNDFKKEIGDVKIAKSFDYKLEELMELSKISEDIEGWVIESDIFMKIKTSWYMDLHGLLTDDLYRENIIVGYILDDNIDDILGQVPEDQVDVHERINRIIISVKYAINEKVLDIKKSYNIFLKLNKDPDNLNYPLMRKSYGLKYGKDPNFSNVMSMSKDKDVYDLAIEWVRKQNLRLMDSREFLNKIDNIRSNL